MSTPESLDGYCPDCGWKLGAGGKCFVTNCPSRAPMVLPSTAQPGEAIAEPEKASSPPVLPEGAAEVERLRKALEHCSVLFFLQVQQLAVIRDTLEAEGFTGGPGTILGTLAHMKAEIRDQDAEIRAALAQVGGSK